MTSCTCGADQGQRRNHDPRTCALVLEALGRLPPADPGRPAYPQQPGAPSPAAQAPRSRHQAAKPTTRRGITYRSKVEADLADHLHLRAQAEHGLVVRQPRMDLWSSWAAGMAKPPTWTPDFLYLAPAGEHRQGPPRLVSLEDLRVVAEIHEAKTARGLESQDYKPRLAAFRAMCPWVPVFVWRRQRGVLVREQLPQLQMDSNAGMDSSDGSKA